MPLTLSMKKTRSVINMPRGNQGATVQPPRLRFKPCGFVSDTFCCAIFTRSTEIDAIISHFRLGNLWLSMQASGTRDVHASHCLLENEGPKMSWQLTHRLKGGQGIATTHRMGFNVRLLVWNIISAPFSQMVRFTEMKSVISIIIIYHFYQVVDEKITAARCLPLPSV